MSDEKNKNEQPSENNLNDEQRMAVVNMHKTFLEALRHREQEILRFLAILAPSLGGFVWLLQQGLTNGLKPYVFIVGTLGIQLFLLLGAIYSLALSYNYRHIIFQLATIEGKDCLNIDKYILKIWPRKTCDFRKYKFKIIPWCDPPEIIKCFWLAFITGVIGVTLAVQFIPLTTKGCFGKRLILGVGLLCFFISLFTPVWFGCKLHNVANKQEKKKRNNDEDKKGNKDKAKD